MRFWDASAVVPLLVSQALTDPLVKLYESDPYMQVWWGTEIECMSAIARAERELKLSPRVFQDAIARLRTLSESWAEVQPVEMVKQQSIRLLRIHNLRAADALQLAAAILSSEHKPETLDFACLDSRLIEAAQREGFTVVPAP